MKQRIHYLPSKLILGFSLAFLLAATTMPAVSSALQDTPKRPSSDSVLPETCVLYIQVSNLPKLMEDMQETNFGRMMNDEKLAPLLEDLWGQALDAYEDLNEAQDIGISAEDLLNFPHGEVCFAVNAPRRKDIEVALLIDIDEESDVGQRIYERIQELAERDGQSVGSEDYEETTITNIGDNAFMFNNAGTVVLCSTREFAEQILDRWMGREVEKIRPLKDNRSFTTIMNRCRGTKDMPAEIRYYVDPINFFKAGTRGNTGAQLAVNFLPALGLDGLTAIGGTSILNEGEFQSVSRMHVMLANPRAGIIEMLSLKPSEYQPAPWVPEDASNYISTSWDLDKMYSELTKLVDFFGGEGTFQARVVDEFAGNFEMDLKEDVLDAFNGTFTWITWNEKPARVNSQANGIGLGIKDVEKAEAIAARIMELANQEEEGRLVEETHKGVTLWRIDTGELQDRFRTEREEGRMRMELRAPEPSFAIVGQTFVIGDSAEVIRTFIDTDRGDYPRLVENEDFERISEKMTRLLRSDMPSAVLYSQPKYVFEQWLEIAKGADVDSALGEFEANEDLDENAAKYIGGIRRALKDNPLPNFEDLTKYMAPSGAFIQSDDTGYHILQFELKADDKR